MGMEIKLPVIIALLIIFLQFIFFIRTKRNIDELEVLFPEFESAKKSPYKMEYDELPSSSIQRNIESDNENESSPNYSIISVPQVKKLKGIIYSENFQKIVISINKYLQKNIGITADFEILKSIVDRIVDAEKDKIAHSINRPLYIGLMGTFLGVIIGIVFIVLPVLIDAPNQSSDNSLTSTINDRSIHGFLAGVAVSMLASFVGLFLTTINNTWFFKTAKDEKNKRRNDFLNFLQTELLPEMNKDLHKNITNLNVTLENFNQSFSNVLINNLNNFNAGFEKNITLFADQIKLINQNIESQTDFLNKIEQIGVKKIVNANLEIFRNITENQALFQQFYDYARSLQTSIETSLQLGQSVNGILDRVTEFEKSINNLGIVISQNDSILLRLGKMITQYFKTVRRYENALYQHVSISESDLQVFLQTEKNKILELLQTFTEGMYNIKTVLLELAQDTGAKIREEMEKAAGDKAFDKLHLLENINKTLSEVRDNKKDSYGTAHTPNIAVNFTPVLEKLEKLHYEIASLNQKMSPPILSFSKWLQFHFKYFRNGHRKYENPQ